MRRCRAALLAGVVAVAFAASPAVSALAQSFDDDSPITITPLEPAPPPAGEEQPALELGPIEGDPLEYRPVDPAAGLSYEPLEQSPLVLGPERVITEATAVEAQTGTGAVLRALDKISGEREDLTLRPGQVGRFGRLELRLGECRYPADNPEGDAFAWLVIGIEGQERPLFSGWMIASSPALNAMDHHRYDVWVIRCTTS